MASQSGSYGHVAQLSPTSDVLRGEWVVIRSVVGVAMADIKSAQTGPVALEGVFNFKKRTDATPINLGQKVYAANSEKTINSGAAQGHTTFCGYALNASPANSKATVDVLLVKAGA